ncbi:hypothetical protein PR048_022968 [Dryococelus australis]|uniref:Uncharacterized protein n=1 Tax=Dryococelus australis TaxID=614101 RepID=A0ABQ9GSS5_9NEOP|nr:hypothetical protein PR048_022968 [Dryococelus australis]
MLQMECELKSLRRELDGTKEALRLQTVRCRQLVAAFTSKLQEKEAEVRTGRLLRDRQLSSLLRALLVLEARLRREQRSIRDQLARKDALIRTQHREIARLRHRMRGEKISEEDCDPDTPAPAPNPTATIARYKKNQTKSHSHRIFKPMAKKDENGDLDEKNVYPKVIIKTCDKHDADEIEKYQELERLANTLKQELDGQTEDDIGPDHEEVTRDLYKDYQHNPVLECVNQILLRDKDDAESTEEETKSHVSVKPHYRDHGTMATMQNKVSEDVKQTKDKTPSPPLQAQKLEEKACVMMSTHGLSVVRHPELEEMNSKNVTGHQTRSSVPPALPPKPPQLGSKSLFLQQKKLQASHVQSGQHSHPSSDLTNTDKLKTLSDCGQKPGSQQNMFITHCHDPQSFPGSTHIHNEKPRQRQILSNGSLKRALNQENASQGMVNGFHHNSSEENEDSSPVRRFKEKLDSLNLSNFTKDSSSQVSVPQFASSAPPPPLKHIASEQNMCGAIKVGSSVSSLITGSYGGSIVTELTQEKAPNVPLLVRRFEEGAKDALQGNFEEFRLEDVDMESKKDGDDDKGRPEADGAETKGEQLHSTVGVNYEHFLEATGLSQKSILTPSRMLSNHRSVIKPKDVKHRSKVLRAQTVVSAAPVGGGPVVKYWMEPFL